MEDYQFISGWTRVTTPPFSGTRCIVTDGDTVVIGTYAGGTWILEGINSSIPFNIIGWMECPRPMKRVIVYEEIVVGDKKPI